MKEIIDLSQYLREIPITSDELCSYLYSSNSCISLLLDFDKAKQWPFFHKKFTDERIHDIPILWALFIPKSPTQIELLWDIHPMKCFPSLYVSNNPNYPKKHIDPQQNNFGKVLSGCPRYVVYTNNREYSGRQNEYCSAFGLPDDCYDLNFESEYRKILSGLKGYTIWFFESSHFLKTKCPTTVNKQFMKDSFLPHKYFFFIDTASQFLSGIYRASDIAGINANYWYSNGQNFIKERDYNKSGISFRFEDSSLVNIKEKVIYELIRLSILLKDKQKFEDFVIRKPPLYNEALKNQCDLKISKIISDVETKNEPKLNSVIQSILPKLNQTKLKRTNFVVLDVEFFSVNYPTKNPTRNIRSFKFPCIFSSIYWNSTSLSAEIDTNVLTLPCHYCAEKCRAYRKHSLDFNCTFFTDLFIKNQVQYFEEKLARCDSLKLYSYGNGDFKQLEYSDNFFINSSNARLYYRKNRKKAFRIVHIADDISKPDTRLAEIEENELKRWLIGWSRQGKHVNVNRLFSTPFSKPDFQQRYHDAIETCVSDSISAFFYLLYKDYRLNDDPIAIRQDVQKTLF